MIPIVLGTRSAGRRGLADKAGLNYTFTESPYDDPPNAPEGCDTVTAVSVVVLARAINKAIALAPTIDTKSVIVTADTMCSDRFAILGKAASDEEAFEVISRFPGHKQTVITACVVATTTPSPPGIKIHVASVYAADVVCGTVPTVPDKDMDTLVTEWIAAGLWRGCSGSIRIAEMLSRGWPLEFKAVDLALPHYTGAGATPTMTFTGVSEALSFRVGRCVGAGPTAAPAFGQPLDGVIGDLAEGEAVSVHTGDDAGGLVADVSVVFTPSTYDTVAAHVTARAGDALTAAVQDHLREVVVGLPITVLLPVIAAAAAVASE